MIDQIKSYMIDSVGFVEEDLHDLSEYELLSMLDGDQVKELEEFIN